MKRLYDAERYRSFRDSPEVELLRIKYVSDGLKVVGFVYKPKATAGRKLPAIIFCRCGAGEEAKIGAGNFFYLAEMHRYASEGFVVLASQYRGTDGGEGKDEVGGADTNDVVNLFPLARAQKALEDPGLTHGEVIFRNGVREVNGYLARPRAAGPRRAVVILHGNTGLPEDIRNTAAQAAQAGFVGLAVSPTSRWPDMSKFPREVLRGNTFGRWYMEDVQAGIDYLKGQPFFRGPGVGLVGFCGGGIVGIMFSTITGDVSAVVALYAAPYINPESNSATDPRPHMISFIGRVRVPLQCHFGTADAYIPTAHVGRLRREVSRRGVRAEIYTYEGAAHGFANYTDSTYRPAAAKLAEGRMLRFFKRYLP